jgi:hypothetical protein
LHFAGNDDLIDSLCVMQETKYREGRGFIDIAALAFKIDVMTTRNASSVFIPRSGFESPVAWSSRLVLHLITFIRALICFQKIAFPIFSCRIPPRKSVHIYLETKHGSKAEQGAPYVVCVVGTVVEPPAT